MATTRPRLPVSTRSYSFVTLVLGASLLSFAWGHGSSSSVDRDHRHARLTVGAAATIRGEIVRLEEQARERPDAIARGVAWLDEDAGVRTVGQDVNAAALRSAHASLADLCDEARDAGRPGVSPSPLAASSGELLVVVPLEPGAGFLVDTRIAAGIPPGALAQRVRLHGMDSEAEGHLTIEPPNRDGQLGLRSSLSTSFAVSSRALLFAFALIGVGFFGLLSPRRRVEVERALPPESTGPQGDLPAFQEIPYPVLIHRDGRIAWTNPAAASGLHRGSPFALLGTRVEELLDAGQSARWREHLRQLDGGGRVAISELVFRVEDVGTCAAEVRSVRVSFDGQPSVESVIGLTPWLPAQRGAATEIESLARPTLDALEDGVLVIDRSGAISEVNAGAEGLLGYSAPILRRMDVASLCSSATGEDLARLRSTLRCAIRGERADSLELEVRRRDGRTLPCFLSARPMQIPGRIVLVIRTA